MEIRASVWPQMIQGRPHCNMGSNQSTYVKSQSHMNIMHVYYA